VGTPGSIRIPATPSGPTSAAVPVRQAVRADDRVVTLSRPGRRSYWAPVLRPAVATARPSGGRRIGRLTTRTPEGTTNAVLLLARTERRGRPWVKVRLPILPNNSVGWIPRSSLGGYQSLSTHLVVDRTRLRATLVRGGRAIFAAPVAIGARRSPTPAGRFYIRNKLTGYSSPFYGPLAFGTSARSAVLTDWPAGGFVGIHGTNRPGLIPGRVSHGCIRMRNRDIVRLGRLMPPGTPLTIT
jgi:lipoprotein-anchoring transpeptidase ErfK/SrfK